MSEQIARAPERHDSEHHPKGGFSLLRKREAALLVPSLIAFLSAAGLIYVFFPGYMSFDSLYQWKQVHGELPLHDGFPVIMVYLWRVFSWIWDSPGTLLIFHQIIHWTAIVMFAVAVAHSTLWRSVVVLVLGFWPPLLIHSIHLWKDEGMLAGLSLAIAALALHGVKPRKSLLVIAAFGLFYATAVRHNAITGTVVLLVLLASAYVRQFLGSPNQLCWNIPRLDRRIVATIFGTVVLLGGTLLGTTLINKTAPPYNGFSMIQTWDIAAVSVAEKRNLLPSYMKPVDPSKPLLPQLRANMNPTNLLLLTNVVTILAPPEYEKTYTRHWIGVITKYPAAYLRHRMSVFAVLMGWSTKDVYYPYTSGIDPNDMGIDFANIGQSEKGLIDSIFAASSRTPLYRAWIYVVLAGALGAFLTFRLLSKGLSYNLFAAWLLAGSVYGIVLPLFFAAPAPDFRYVLWVVMATLMAIILVLRDITDLRRPQLEVK